MNVKELIDVLIDLPDTMEVILQKDAEGNGYSPLEGVHSNVIYVPDSTYSGRAYDLDLPHNDHLLGKDEWDDLRSVNEKTLVLFPVN